MTNFIKIVYKYLETTYHGKVIRDEITKKFWESYLTDDFEFNPKYFKFTGSWKGNDGREYIISANLPDKIVRQSDRINKKTYKEIKQGVFNSLNRQAVISQFQNEKRLAFFPEIVEVNILTYSRDASLYFIQMEKVDGQNIFQYFYLNPTEVPEAILDFPELISQLMKIKLPEELDYKTEFISDRIDRAEKGLFFLKKITGIKSTKVLIPEKDVFVDVDYGVLYADCTPHNFLISDRVFTGRARLKLLIVDLETLGNFYLNFSLAYNLIYFLIHLPYLNAQPERKKIVEDVYKLAIDKEKFTEALKVCFLAHASEVIDFSKSRKDQELHRNLVLYNTVVAKKILSGINILEALF